MSPKAPFVITQFKNPSGEVVFRVVGWLDGKRVRKNFRTRQEAEAERQIIEVQRALAESGIRTAITRLSDDAIRDAEAANQIKAKIETRVKNVPEANRQRAFLGPPGPRPWITRFGRRNACARKTQRADDRRRERQLSPSGRQKKTRSA